MGLLLLALVPLAILPGIMEHADAMDPEDTDTPDNGADDPSADGSASGAGDILDGIGLSPSGGGEGPDGASPDSAGPDGAGPDDPIAPLNEDDVPGQGGAPVDPASVLSPLDENDAPGGGGGSTDGLLPVDTIEGNQPDVWLNLGDAGGTGVFEVQNFDPGHDHLHLSIDAANGAGNPVVSVTASQDGQDGLVYVDGELVALLPGAPDATLADIVVHLAGIPA